jgi:hypothetical protein
MMPDNEKGEGNDKAGRKFQQAQREFAKDKDRVARGAEEAAEAIDGPESEELEHDRKERAERGNQ